MVVYRDEFEHIVGVLSRGELLKAALAGKQAGFVRRHP